MTIPFPSPTTPAISRTEVFVRYLEFFRSRMTDKLRSLPAAELRSSRLPSGWTPLELVKHLRHVERRWLEWGFAGADIKDPWADRRDERWYVAPNETLDSLLAALAAQAAVSTAIITAHDLADVGQPGERWDGKEPASLERVLFHLLQEYARHVGHLDIVAELATGDAGELPPPCRAVPGPCGLLAPMCRSADAGVQPVTTGDCRCVCALPDIAQARIIVRDYRFVSAYPSFSEVKSSRSGNPSRYPPLACGSGSCMRLLYAALVPVCGQVTAAVVGQVTAGDGGASWPCRPRSG